MEEGIKSRTPQSIYIEHGVWEAFVCGNLTNGRALRNAADWPQVGSMEEGGLKKAGIHFAECFAWGRQCVFASMYFQPLQPASEEPACSLLGV